jgi:hypothetical protein
MGKNSFINILMIFEYRVKTTKMFLFVMHMRYIVMSIALYIYHNKQHNSYSGHGVLFLVNYSFVIFCDIKYK